ncbi:epoxide hydrolase family protein [Amycolatopsis sp. lyj-112]|uniref:epoxide hydrolase family protein n=1 Tax=Amycolatopsis sp. lyj-112 TaxID=2789288 RepID=UPI00397D9180
MVIEPYEVRIPESAITDLRARLRGTRWPEPATVDDWEQGVPLGFARELCRYWAEDYDFGLAGRVNSFPNFKTTVDGLGIHFLHVRSPEPDATPLVLTHGWPGSVVEFLEVLGPLTDPRAYGGDPADAFHVVAPSLPGFGWSDKPPVTGWTVERIARAWDEVMGRLGYERYVAQGGDWGSAVTNTLAKVVPERLIAVHVNMAGVVYDEGVLGAPTPAEKKTIGDLVRFRAVGSAYAQQQATRPQTIGYGLTDSPAAQAAWIAEKFWEWTDNDGSPESALSWRRMLDAISVYWFTATAASSARIYWENKERDLSEVAVPSGISIFPREIIRPSRRWAELRYTDLRWYEELPKGGHFAAFEQPEAFVGQLRGFIRSLR